MKKFTFDGFQGTIDSRGFITWHTIRCHMDALRNDSPLRIKALAAK